MGAKKPAGEPKVVPGGFVKGDDPRRGPSIVDQPNARNSRRKGPPVPTTPVVQPPEDGAPAALQDARFVYQNEEGHDKTQGHKNMRDFLKRDPKGFVAQMTALESEHRDRLDRLAREKEKVEKAGVEVEDVGTARALAICEEWLKEHGVSPGKPVK